MEASNLENILKSEKFTSSVSSVWFNDHKQFGKKHLFDGKDDTPWNSN